MFGPLSERSQEIRNEKMNMIAESLDPGIELKDAPDEFDNERWLEAELEALEEQRERLR
jgi:hypothetical protein